MIESRQSAGDRDGAGEAESWERYASALAGVLARMTDDQFLIVFSNASGRYVQFAAQGPSGMRAEVVGNPSLPPSTRLDDRQVECLVGEGWSPPTAALEEASAGVAPPAESEPTDPNPAASAGAGTSRGCPNFYIDLPDPVDFPALARQAVRALRLVGVAAASDLGYDAFLGRGGELSFPELGTRRERKEEAARPALEETGSRGSAQGRLLAAVRLATGLQDLEPDADGDVPVRCGAVLAFLRIVADPMRVFCFAPLVGGLRGERELLACLNLLNTGSSPVRFVLADDTVFGVAVIPARPLVAAHVASTLQAFCGRCDGVGTFLAERFDGELAGGESRSTATLH